MCMGGCGGNKPKTGGAKMIPSGFKPKSSMPTGWKGPKPGAGSSNNFGTPSIKMNFSGKKK